MPDDIMVYSPSDSIVSIVDILERASDYHLSVQWTYRLHSEVGSPGEWTSGFFEAEDESSLQVTIFNEPITPSLMEEIVKGYKDLLTEANHDLFQRSSRRYQLAPQGLFGEPQRRLLLNLADIIAELSDGLIYHSDDDKFYDLTTFRSRYARLLDRPS